MSTPEPLDEHPAGSVEIRGGDRPQNWAFPEYDSDGTFPYLQPELPFDEDDA